MPYWRLSSYYFFYFAVLGILMPYWSLYLQHLGFDPRQIGILLAFLMGAKIIAPNLWGWLADHLGKRMTIVRVAALVSILIFAVIFFVRDFWGMALAMVAFSFFYNASLPQMEVVTFNYLRTRIERYAHVRLWGSIGFICTVTLVGMLVDWQGAQAVPYAMMALFVGVLAASLTVPDPVIPHHNHQQESILVVLKKPAIWAFMAAVILMQAGHGPYYTFYSIYLEGQGYSKSLIGALWALGVLAEVLVFLFMHHLHGLAEGRVILIASMALAGLRWLLIGWFPESLPVLLFAQLLHAASFGTFHAAGIHLVHHFFKGKHQGRGQAMYSSLGFGAGGALGSLGSGLIWQPFGATASFTLAAVCAFSGAVIAWLLMDDPVK